VLAQQRRRERGEHTHADDGNRGEQPGDRVRDPQRRLDPRQQRADPDDLRPQHEPDEEE
jgi:hypothetical protein